MLAPCANSLFRSNHLGTSTLSPTVSNKWPQQFLKQYSQYAIQRQKTLDLHRKNANRQDELQAWFEKFHHLYVERGIQAEDCYNMDETGFRIGIGKDRWSITKDRDKRLYLPSANNRDLITAVECVSAAGKVISPMFILPGVLHQQAWFTNIDIDDDYFLATSSTGYSNNILNAKWIRHFHTQTVSRQREVWRLLLLDGYTSHCTYKFITYCDAQKILPFNLPPHATHLLQPLDVVLFQLYKHWHAIAVDETTRTGCHDFNKIEFLAVIKSIRQLTFKSSSIKSSF